jgi:hypothetical protein
MAVMTERFVSAAELMARVLGMPGYPFVVISHPVSSASGDELEKMARISAQEVRRLLISS